MLGRRALALLAFAGGGCGRLAFDGAARVRWRGAGPQRVAAHVLITNERLATELAVARPFPGIYALESVNLRSDVAYLIIYTAP